MKHKITLIVLLFISTFGFAQDYTWTGALTGNWNNANNWSNSNDNGNPGLPVNNGNVRLLFDNNVQLTMTNDLAMTDYVGFVFMSNATSARTIGGNTEITIVNINEGIKNESSATHIINFPIQMSNSVALVVHNFNGGTGGFTFGGAIALNSSQLALVPHALATYTFNNVISGTESVAIYSGGTVYFKAANTYSGTTTIGDGTLILEADLANSAINPSSGTLSIDGANIDIGSLAGGSNISLVNITSGSSLTSGNFNNSGALILQPNSSLTVNGNLSHVGAATNLTLNSNTTVTVNGDLLIQSGFPVINSGATVNVTGNFTLNTPLEIPNGATVNVTGNLSNNNGVITIQPGGKLTVGGTFNRGNSVDMIIHSDATGSGSFVHSGTGTAELTYNQYLTGSGNWHMIAVPVIGNPNDSQAISNFITSYGASMVQSGVKYSLAYYDNTGVIDMSTWKHYTTDGSNPAPSNAAFIQGKGYEILMTNTQTVGFRGAIPSSTVNIGITEGLSGWNLIGNPFPSSIFANATAGGGTNNFLTVNSAQLDQSFVAMYVWNPTNGSYDLVNHASGARSFAPGQAFFVQAKTGGGSVDFTTAMRTHQTANLFQKGTTAAATPTITLSADNNSGTVSSTNIKYMSGTTLGLDPGYDAGQFGATGAGNFNLYTQLVQDNGVNFALQVVPDTNYETTVIPVGIDANSGTQLTFKATATDLPEGKKVFLEDKLLNTITEINNTDKSYTVTLSSSLSGTGRFYIHTLSEVLAIDDFSASQYKLVTSPENNNIRLYGTVAEKGSVDIFDTFGRKIYSTTLQRRTEQNIKVPVMATGVYIVKFTIDNKPFSKKILWY